ncbi:MAG: GTPase HflX [Peptoniphilaceae bacterium]|nr:GTPase HflX [Bacillota bacterium]
MERVIAVTAYERNSENNIKEKTEEFVSLIEAADAEVVIQVEQALQKMHPATVIGSGKVDAIKAMISPHAIDAVCFNVELSGSQIRNLEEALGCKIIDRTHVILDIFANRASDREGKLQVKLAQLRYRLPRLTGYRSYLSRTGGGIGTRGPGEQQLETDRRHIQREMQQIKRALSGAEKTRRIKSGRRRRGPLPVVALIGYTNAGKSTVLNGLHALGGGPEKKEVSARNRLFETLSTAHRHAVLPGGASYVLMDTVGFVSDLPTEFIEAFQSTLEEIVHADLILHVIDGSSETIELQIDTTMDMLRRLDSIGIPRMTLINKTDRIDSEYSIADKRLPNRLWISAKQEADIRRVAEKIESMLYPEGAYVWHVPYARQEDFLRRFHHMDFFTVDYEAEGARFCAYLTNSQKARLKRWEREER